MRRSRAAQLACAAGLLAAILLAVATGADAQGFYYKEIRKDERIYVFNNAEEAARFEKSGEMGRSITRLGAGPNGETVVADSERALQLFFFKYNIAEVVPEPTPPTQRIEWRDGKTRITTDLAYLELSNRIQTRYTHEFPDDTVKLPGTADAGDSKGSFRIRRAKMKLEGWFWRPANLTYEVQMNWPDVAGSNAAQFLEDANIAWDFTGTGRFRVLFGQFKAPFGRQELTSSGNQSFVDRALVSNFYSPARQTGAAVQGVLWDNRLEYRAGVFNGNGRTQALNDNDKFLWTGRLMWQPNGNQPLAQRAWVSGALYSEGDFESTAVPLYGLAVQFLSNNQHRTTTTPANNFDITQFGVDGVFKFKGFCAVGEWYWRQQERETSIATAPTKFEAPGWFLQVGQMLNTRRTWEAAFRYGWRDPNNDSAPTFTDDENTEIRGGLSYYNRRHTLKFQADYGQIEVGQGITQAALKSRELRMQAQFIF